jgi:peptidoglycan hydrolase-like protein with peptidoglycan-binding domain
MKNRFSAILAVILLFSLLSVSALADTGVVNASSLNIRESASSKSDVIKVVKEGTKIEIKGTSGSWYKVSVGGKTGYASKKYITVSSDKKSSASSSSSDSGKKQNSSDGTCKKGDKGDAVKAVQKRLKALGYYNSSVDGDFGDATKSAVKKFQKNNGLTDDGVVGKKTLEKLNSSKAKKASASSGNDKKSDELKTEKLDWFNGGSKVIPKGATFKVKDIKTGKVFTVKRWSGYNHIDAEPLTSSDTKTMKAIYGHWSWKRRAVLVKYNGHVYAASMNGMPHGTSTISDNKFDGHFCIHFTGSKTHGTGKVDKTHQECVKEALKHTW